MPIPRSFVHRVKSHSCVKRDIIAGKNYSFLICRISRGIAIYFQPYPVSAWNIR